MKKLIKITAISLAVCLVAALLPICAFADNGTMNITLRIEGINGTLYQKTLSVPYTDTLSVQELIIYADEHDDGIVVTGITGPAPYITDINGEYAGTFGGWDGWLFNVNGEEPAAGMNAVNLTDGDNVIVYYGDPYGIGMQYPKLDLSRIGEGIIRFTSLDTTYDESFNPITAENPVADMTVIFDNDTSNTYKTNADGIITVSPAITPNGTHTINVEKKNAAGLPLVLRFEPNKTIDIAVDPSKLTDETTDDKPKSENADTSDRSTYTFAVAIVLSLALIIVLSIKERRYV